MYHRGIEDRAKKECDSCKLPDCYPHSALCAAPLKQVKKKPSLKLKLLELLVEYGPLSLETIAYDLEMKPSDIERAIDYAIRRGDVMYRNGGYVIA